MFFFQSSLAILSKISVTLNRPTVIKIGFHRPVKELKMPMK